jgi:PAS domain S-box-containing protein
MSSDLGRDPPNYIRLLVDHVPSMLAYWDRGLHCRFANRAYQHWFGIDPDRLIGMSIGDLLGPELFAMNEPYILAALSGREQVFERVVPGPDGVQRHSLATYVPDVVDGEVKGFIAHVTEVTQLKQAEAALREEGARREVAIAQLRESKAALVEAQRLGGVGNWAWEISPDITVWSDGLYRIFGRDPMRLPPAFAEHPALYSEESWGRLQAAVATAVRTGEPYALELQYLRADGQSGWLEARGEAVRAEGGDIVRLRGTTQEITQRRRMEEARIKAKAAEEANRNKTQMLARTSHELRTPLNAILGFSQLFEMDQDLDPKYRRWAAAIIGAGRHMLGLVDEILDISAADAGRIDIQRAEVEVVSIIRECILQASAAAAAGGITLRCLDPSSAPVRVLGDARRLKQVIDNLLSNAIKYNHAGGLVTVTLSAGSQSVEVAIQDTGMGMTDEQRERLFRPFERLGAEATAIPGTGLGLALSKTLVELMGGRIQVESRPGSGSTFTVSLPREIRHDGWLPADG